MNEGHAYLKSHGIPGLLDNLITDTLKRRPERPVQHMTKWLANSTVAKSITGVCVIGHSPLAFALAAITASRGLHCTMFCMEKEPTQKAREAIEIKGGIDVHLEGEHISGCPAEISGNPSKVVPGCNILLMALPVSAYLKHLKAIKPFLKANSFLGAVPGEGGFDWIARQVLGQGFQDASLFAFSPSPYMCTMSEDGQEIDVQTVVRKFVVSSLKSEDTEKCRQIVECLFHADVAPVPHMLAITLNPMSAIIHPARCYHLLSSWSPTDPIHAVPKFYAEMDEASVGLMELISTEVRLIAKAIQKQTGLDLKIPTLHQHLKWMHGDNESTDCTSVQSIFQTCKAYHDQKGPFIPTEDSQGWRPKVRTSYFQEDVPMGLCIIKGLAEVVNVMTPCTDIVVKRLQQIMKRQYVVGSGLIGEHAFDTHHPTRFGIFTAHQLIENNTTANLGLYDIMPYDELLEGQMREVTFDPSAGDAGKALLAKSEGVVYAVASRCSHHGFWNPLVNGILSGGRVRCPMHGSCFNLRTGDLEDYPSLEGLQTYGVQITSGIIRLIVDRHPASATKPISPQGAEMIKIWPKQRKLPHFAIVGGGAAALAAADTLRKNGFQGRITIFSKESALPYYRWLLSKDWSSPVEDIIMRPLEWYQERRIEVRLNAEVVEVALNEKLIALKDGTLFTYDKVLLATGGNPNSLNVPGIELDGILTFRTPWDAQHIASRIHRAANIVIVGLSFLALETAAQLGRVTPAPKSVTVVGRGPCPFFKIFGEQMGFAVYQNHEREAIQFRFNAPVMRFEGKNGKVTDVVLDGDTVPADTVILCVGTKPATDYIKGLQLREDGGIDVNLWMEAAPDVFAAGDIAAYPYPIHGRQRIEHWQMAQSLGQVAALNMMGIPSQVTSIPYFSTTQFGKVLRFTGFVNNCNDIIFTADPHSNKVAGFYAKDDTIVGVIALTEDAYISAASELLKNRTMPSKSEIKSMGSNGGYIDLTKFFVKSL